MNSFNGDLSLIPDEYLQPTYPVMETFYSLQGEGYWSGSAAFFIRLAGCDIQCFWCDVQESWEQNTYPSRTVKQILQEILENKADRVVITGGEPTLHNLTPLTKALQTANLKVHLETAGNHEITGFFDWVCLSPKKFCPVLAQNYPLANELKIIVRNQHDLEWAAKQAEYCTPKTLKYLQPEWTNFEKAIHWIIPYIQQNTGWKLSLQIHKYLNIR